MTHAALLFALSAAVLVGALLTMCGAAVQADSRRWALDLGMGLAELRVIASAVALAGLMTFIAAACSILAAVTGA